jgi:hypothetical protein
LLLNENLSLEIHPIPQLHELMGVARIAVFTGKFATAIRIDRPVKGKIARAHYPAEHGPRPQGKVFNIVALTQRLALGSHSRNANELRGGTDFLK